MGYYLEAAYAIFETLKHLDHIYKSQNLKTSWKFLRQKVKRFVTLCLCCQKMSQIKIRIAAHPLTISSYSPMECLNIDSIGHYPDDGYVLVIFNTFTNVGRALMC
jgi:hypothetical protein